MTDHRRSKSWATRAFEAADRSQNASQRYAQLSDNRLSRWFTRFSTSHLVLGPLLQSTLVVGVFMIVAAAVVQFRYPIFLTVLGLAVWAVVSIWGYGYNKWRRENGASPRP
jgi:hypothetical protein